MIYCTLGWLGHLKCSCSLLIRMLIIFLIMMLIIMLVMVLIAGKHSFGSFYGAGHSAGANYSLATGSQEEQCSKIAK